MRTHTKGDAPNAYVSAPGRERVQQQSGAGVNLIGLGRPAPGPPSTAYRSPRQSAGGARLDTRPLRAISACRTAARRRTSARQQSAETYGTYGIASPPLCETLILRP